MRLLTSQELSYRPNGGHGQPGICWLRLYTGPAATGGGAHAVAVVTELNINPGPSVTNAAEAIRTTILAMLFDEWGFGPVDLTVYEHYNDLISYGRPASHKQGDRYALHKPDAAFGPFRVAFAPASYAEVLEAVGDAGLVDLGRALVRCCVAHR